MTQWMNEWGKEEKRERDYNGESKLGKWWNLI
jgi:hypothetical protein